MSQPVKENLTVIVFKFAYILPIYISLWLDKLELFSRILAGCTRQMPGQKQNKDLV